MSASSSSEVLDGIGRVPVRPIAVVYCEGNFGKIDGKTANGLVRQSETYVIASVIDSTCRGRDAGMVLDGVPNGVRVVGDLDEALAHGHGNPAIFIVGLAPTSGLLSDEERNVILHAIARGLHVVSGLHEFLTQDAEFVAAAHASGVLITDVRMPRAKKDLRMFTGRIRDVTCPRIAVLGTDGAIGKRTTATILTKALNDHGIRAVMVSTGQTGLIQGARYGVALDAVPAQFVTGELEGAVLEAFDNENPDVIIVEGQGALSHPTRKSASDFPDFPMPTAASEIKLIELFAKTKVIGLTINHELMTDDDVVAAIALYELELGIPVTDALWRSGDRLVEMVLASFPSLHPGAPIDVH
jgi:uncharacterized NAD-dependent epimerase/dehydratase family protein